MTYRKEIYEEALSELARRRAAALSTAEQRRAACTAQHPRLGVIEAEMRDTVTRIGQTLAAHNDPSRTVADCCRQNLALQEEMRTILHDAGCTFENFEPPYTCPLCEDTGYTDRGMCDCLRRLLSDLSCKRLSTETGMKLTSFEEMELRFYPADIDEKLGRSPRAQMADVIDYGRRYAADFSENSPSLLLRGPTGVGKTHFSLALAAEVARKGAQVIYGPVQTLLHRLEREQFGREEGESEPLMIEADLLILDDLGMELSRPFFTAALYNILNGRILTGRPTIISTNLRQSQLQERYGDAIVSRITGHFIPLLFVGRDIRQIKLQETLR